MKDSDCFWRILPGRAPDFVTEIKIVKGPGEMALARELFTEYARNLDFDLSFQSFEQELAELPVQYGSPGGRLLLAYQDGWPAGCVGLREFEPGVCEMKRLYVRPVYRGQGVGHLLARRVIDEARAIGYRSMRLDTVPGMSEAIALYESLGFLEIPAYRSNPIPGTKYMELKLQPSGQDGVES